MRVVGLSECRYLTIISDYVIFTTPACEAGHRRIMSLDVVCM